MFEKDHEITGEHAAKLKFLAKKNAKDSTTENFSSAKIFERYIDVYMNAVVFGLRFKHTAKADNSNKTTARIFAEAFAKERENCIFLYRLVMLLDETSNLTPEERIDRAFRYNENSAEFRQNMELFHDYVRGGIEIMYEQFADGCYNQNDYFRRTFEVMEKLNDADINPEIMSDPVLMVEHIQSQNRH